MRSLIRALEHTGIPDAGARALVVVCLFLAAALLARLSRLLANRIEARAARVSLDSPLIALARRETAVSLTYSSV